MTCWLQYALSVVWFVETRASPRIQRNYLFLPVWNNLFWDTSQLVQIAYDVSVSEEWHSQTKSFKPINIVKGKGFHYSLHPQHLEGCCSGYALKSSTMHTYNNNNARIDAIMYTSRKLLYSDHLCKQVQDQSNWDSMLPLSPCGKGIK